jgi:hypothetical protein
VALSKLKNYEGTVYRGTVLPDSVLSRFLPGNDLEPRTFLFLTDTQEWVAQDAEEAAVIREAHPEAKIILASALSE